MKVGTHMRKHNRRQEGIRIGIRRRIGKKMWNGIRIRITMFKRKQTEKEQQNLRHKKYTKQEYVRTAGAKRMRMPVPRLGRICILKATAIRIGRTRPTASRIANPSQNRKHNLKPNKILHLHRTSQSIAENLRDGLRIGTADETQSWESQREGEAGYETESESESESESASDPNRNPGRNRNRNPNPIPSVNLNL